MSEDCSRDYCNGFRIPTSAEYCANKLDGVAYLEDVKPQVTRKKIV